MHWALQWILASGFNTKVSLHEEDISVKQRSEFILQIIYMWYKTLRVQYFDSSLPWLSATNKPFFLMICNKKDYESFFLFEGDHYFSMLNARSVMKATYWYLPSKNSMRICLVQCSTHRSYSIPLWSICINLLLTKKKSICVNLLLATKKKKEKKRSILSIFYIYRTYDRKHLLARRKE